MYSTNGTSLLFLLFLLLMSSLESLCWFVEMLCTHSCRLMVIVSYVIFSLNKYRETLHFRNYKFDMKIGDGLIFSVSLVLRFRKGMTMTDEMNKILKPTQTTTKKTTSRRQPSSYLFLSFQSSQYSQRSWKLL